jgi:dTMP kinase
MVARGLFITMEGGEGVGKSTNLAFLHNYLKNNGVEVVITREPGGTRLGEEIRELLLKVRREGMSAMTELLLIFAARAQHISEIIEPAMAAGKWVLCDRFTDATYAYQCAGRGVEWETVRRLEELVQGKLCPDYTLLLDVSVTVGMARARERGNLDRFEQEHLDFFERVRASYLEQAKRSSGRYRLIDAGLSLDEVQQELLKFGSELLSCWVVRRRTDS